MWGSHRRALVFGLASVLPVACGDAPPAAMPETEDGSSSSGAEMEDESSSGDAEPEPEIPAGCGNGIVEADEECDLGFANAIDGACTPACALPRCGDGLLTAGEACDEGEANGGPVCNEACARPTRLRWSTTLTGSAHDWDLAVAMVPVAESSIVAALYIDEDPSQVVITRFDADGSQPWSTTLTSETVRYYGLTPYLVPTADDGVLMSIFSDVADVAGSERIELRRLDGAGQTRWRHVVVEDGTLGDVLSGRVTLAGDQVVLTVLVEVATDEFSTFVTRLDDDGLVLSERLIEEEAVRTAGTADGGFFSHSGHALMRFDDEDQLSWSVGSSSVGSVAIAVDEQGPVFTRSSAGDRYLEAYTADGQPRWQALLGLKPRMLSVGVGGEIAVVGTADALPGGLSTNLDLAVETFDAAGSQRWIERLDGPAHGEDEGQAVAIAADGSIWAGGDVSVPYELRDVWLGRYEEDPR